MLNGTASEDHKARDLGSHIYDRAAIFLIIVGQNAFGRGKRFEHKLLDIDAGPRHCLYKILPGSARTRNYMNQCFEPRSVHADRFGNAVLSVNNKLLRQTADDLPTGCQRHRAGRINRPLDVIVGNFLFWAGHGDDSIFILAAKMFTGKIDRRRSDIQSADALGFPDRFSDRFGYQFGRSDDTSPQTLRFSLADADDIHLAVRRRLADDAPNAARADIQTNCLYFAVHKQPLKNQDIEGRDKCLQRPPILSLLLCHLLLRSPSSNLFLDCLSQA